MRPIVRECAELRDVAQLRNVALPPDTNGRAGPDPDPHPQAFEPNTAAMRLLMDVMHRLQKHKR